MKKNIKLAPSILSADFATLEKEISILNNSEADNPSTEEVQGDIKTEADSKEKSRETQTKE